MKSVDTRELFGFSRPKTTATMLSLMVMSVSGSLYALCSNVGIVAKSSSVNTSEKNALSNSAFSTSVCAMRQSGYSRSLIPVLVFIFDLAYLKNALGFFFASIAILFSKVRTAFLTSAFALLANLL